MGEQIRTWDKRDQGIDDTGALMMGEKLVLTIDDSITSTVDRLELILQLRELQELNDDYALNYAI